MKKIICLLLVAVLCLGTLTACGSDFEWDNEFGLNYDVSKLNYTYYTPNALYDESGRLYNIVGLDYVTLPEDYDHIQVPASALEATEEELNNHLDNLLKNYGTAEKVTDRAVEAGDTVNLDYIGTVNGAVFSGGNTMGLGTDAIAAFTARSSFSARSILPMWRSSITQARRMEQGSAYLSRPSATMRGAEP